jgi:hypothetical protein
MNVVPESEIVPEFRKTGHRMADLAVAFSALFVSLCSLGIALHHGRTMQRLVEANSRPFIQFIFSNGEHSPGEADHQVMTLLVSNPGAGAARIEKFSVLLDGKVVDNMSEALLRLSGAANAASLGSMTVADFAPAYIKAGSDQVALRWPRTESNAGAWDKALAASREHVSFEACYCSIFDECWDEKSGTFRPAPVKRCG